MNNSFESLLKYRKKDISINLQNIENGYFNDLNNLNNII